MKTIQMQRTLVACLVLGLCGGPLLAEDAESVKSEKALEILKQADEASRAVTTVRFHAKAEPAGVIANFIGAVEGTALMNGWNPEIRRPLKFWAKAEAKAPGTGAEMDMTCGGDGETFFLVDHKTKKGYEDMDPAVLGTGGQTLGALGLAQFVHPEPFQRELDATAIELLGKGEVMGEECWKIRVTYAPGSGNDSGADWCISTRDHLPRQQIRKFAFPQGEGELAITLSSLEVDPKFESALFKMDLPEGYEAVDDFAP
ncbi:MAG: hypothetical protein AAGD06_01615 [Acidobacteriota bacterium]